MTPVYQPYERPPDIAALWTAIPRGMRSFVVGTGELDLKPINDNQLLTLSATLPANFAYVFSAITLSIASDRAGDWYDMYWLNMQNYYQGDAGGGLSSTYLLDWPTIGNGNLMGSTVPTGRADGVHGSINLPSFPMVAGKGSSGILISIQAQNRNPIASSVGTVNAYINFWEFDLEQIRKYPVNSPTPVHSR